MASALKSAFGSSAQSNPLQTFGQPRVYQQGATHAHGGGLLHNLLSDAITSAKGLPFGIVQTVEHPIRAAQQLGHAYEQTYGHGWNHFMQEFHAHPLQPLLDAISVPLLLAGGLGAGVKGASLAAELGGATRTASFAEKASELANLGDFAGRDALINESANSPRLFKAAEHFQKGTPATSRYVEGPSGLPFVARSYSSNLFRRVLTQGADGVIENTLGRRFPTLSAEGLAARTEEKVVGQRIAATTGRQVRQVRGIYRAKKAGIPAQATGEALSQNFHRVMIENAIPATDEQAQQAIATGRWTGLKAAETPDMASAVYGSRGELIPSKMTQATDTVSGTTARPASYKEPTIENFIKARLAGSIHTTNNLDKMARDANGRTLLIRSGTPRAVAEDLGGTHALLKEIYKSPLKVWKYFILGLSPRYFVNNVIGNAGMYAAATNPVEFTRGVYEAIKSVRGIKAAEQFQRDVGNTLGAEMAKTLPNDVVDEIMGYLQHGATSLEGSMGVGSRNVFSRGVKSGLFGVTEKVAYRATQRASIMGALTTMPGFRNLFRSYKASGMDRNTAFQQAARVIMKDPMRAAAVEKRVTDWAGQYYHLNGAEKTMTAMVPFYNWDRHALRFGKEQVLSRPVRTQVMAQIGALGDKQATKELGNLPDFLKGAVPVGNHSGGLLGMLFGQAVNGRKKIILTSGYNPLASAAEDANAIASLVGQGRGPARESLGAQVNPIISGAIAGVTGQKLFSGAKESAKGGVLGSIADETFGQLPASQLLKTGLAQHGIGKPRSTKTKKGSPTLYTHDVRQQLSSILGLNERDFSPQAAKKLYSQEQGIKKGRRRVRYAARKQARSFGGGSALKSDFSSKKVKSPLNTFK